MCSQHQNYSDIQLKTFTSWFSLCCYESLLLSRHCKMTILIMNLDNNLVVLSVNCRGLRDIKKRTDVIEYLKNTEANIICLQDTHWTKQDEREIRKLWNNDCYIHGTKTNARGVAVLFKNDFEHRVLEVETDNIGNMIYINIKINNDFILKLINIYAPNTDEPEFFAKIKDIITESTADYSIICGDFNLLLNPPIDSINYTNINNPSARREVLNMIENHELQDSFRYLYPDQRRYTWRRKNPTKHARLDYFLVSRSLMDLISDSTIKPGYKTDHSIIYLKNLLNSFTRGRGTWKLNTSLLKDKNYVELINNAINDEREKYAVPVYNLDELTNIPDKNLQLIISDQDFLQILLVRLRGESVKYSTYLKKKSSETEKKLIKEIAELEISETLSMNFDLLNDKKTELEEIREIKLKGHMIRSRIQWIDEGEKPTKFFCGLENKNYLNKTIKKLITNDNRTITGQKEILNEVRSFYEKLFQNNDNHLIDVDLENVLKDAYQPKLSDRESNSLEGLLTLEEITKSLKNMKNNKTPGIDGFPAEFFKVFWAKLRHFILRCLNQSFIAGTLPLTMRQCIISCLPKGDKPRQFAKNWRPISLLSVVYKIASASIANRIKPILNKLIDKTQSGFIAGRFIGESTRLVYDIMNHCENYNMNGLLMLIDFEKAFDSVSWDFLYKVLHVLNFGQELISWIKVFNNDVEASVLQCGHLSEFFQIKRGCRQGDPISAYLFILCVQTMYLMIKLNKEIKGITIEDVVYDVSQFADDTTLMLDGSQGSLRAASNTIEIFGSYSGLKMNKEKTRVIWIGRKRFSKDKLNINTKLVWGQTVFELLGIKFSVKLNEMLDLNFDYAIAQIENILNHWNKRYLTPLGKITIIKTFAISKINHLITTLPNPPESFLIRINKLLFQFLWDNKPDKIARKQITQDYTSGGLKMININNIIKCLKLTWIRRLFTTCNSPWVNLFESTISSKKNLIELGSLYAKKLIVRCKNVFWIDTIQSLYSFCNLTPLSTSIDLLTSPIWQNPKISLHELYIPNWFAKNINMVYDIIDGDGSVKTMRKIIDQYNVEEIDFLTYYRIRSCISKFIREYNRVPFEVSTLEHPTIPFYLSKIIKNKKGTKNFKSIFLGQESKIVYKNEKWGNELNIYLDDHHWKTIYKICFKTLQDNYLVWLQYKILNRILGVKKLLYGMRISQDDNCRLCNDEKETIIHLFCRCPIVQSLWENLSNWILNKLEIRIDIDNPTNFLGCFQMNFNHIPLNSLILVTKSYIFWCAKKSRNPDIFGLQKRIKQMYYEQKAIASKNFTQDKFQKQWNHWASLF